MNIVILTIKNPGNIFLANLLSEHFHVAGMIILEEKSKTFPEKLDFWFKAARKYGLYKTINKYVYLKLIHRTEKAKCINVTYYSANDRELDYRFETEIMRTSDINSDETAHFIASKDPDVIAVCGSKVLKPKIFKQARKGTVNIHCGITPDYRSANPVEWALFNRDFDRVGVTIHFVNEGVDTGDVIYQKNIGVQRGDTVSSIYARDIREGAGLMIKAIEDIAEGKVKATSQPANAGKHYMSFEYGYIQNRRVNKILKSI